MCVAVPAVSEDDLCRPALCRGVACCIKRHHVHGHVSNPSMQLRPHVHWWSDWRARSVSGLRDCQTVPALAAAPVRSLRGRVRSGTAIWCRSRRVARGQSLKHERTCGLIGTALASICDLAGWGWHLSVHSEHRMVAEERRRGCNLLGRTPYLETVNLRSEERRCWRKGWLRA